MFGDKMTGLLGKKLGMSNVFNAEGTRIPVTVIEVGPCTVVNLRTNEKDGYNALQLGFGEKKKKRLAKPEAAYFEKNNLKFSAILLEFKVSKIDEYKIGDQISVASVFKEGDKIKVRGYSIGKGFQGVIKRHGFSGVGGTTHGQSDRLRAPGSIGASSFPSRVLKGQRMAGRKGNEKVTIRNLKVIKIVPEKNIMLVKGAVPGSENSIVELYKM
jgi:large subunit ribosomal protein L3